MSKNPSSRRDHGSTNTARKVVAGDAPPPSRKRGASLCVAILVAGVALLAMDPDLRSMMLSVVSNSPRSTLSDDAGQHSSEHNDHGGVLLSKLEVFVCGSRVEWSPSAARDVATGSQIAERRALMIVRNAPKSSLLSIAAAKVDDDYCDCDDGSDEPWSGACSHLLNLLHSSSSSEDKKDVRFVCLTDPQTTIAFSRVNDGFMDCCDGSDEASLVSPREVTDETRRRCAALQRSRSLAHETELRKYRAGNRVFRLRASYGSTTFGPQFIKNVTRDSKEVEAAYEVFQAELQDLRIRMQKQQQQQKRHMQAPSQASAMDADEEIVTVEPEEIQQAQRAMQYFNQKRGEQSQRQALLGMQGLGKYFEYFPLLGACFNTTVHEKQLRGGTAIPEQYNVTFHVCPFTYILQRTETPDVAAADARLALDAEVKKEQHQQQPSEAADAAVTDEGRSAEDIRKDVDTRRFVVVGYWTGIVPDAFENVTSLFVRGVPVSPISTTTTTTTSTPISQYTAGEACWERTPRLAALMFQCDSTDRIVKVVENGMCRYEVLFGTPSACDDEGLKRLEALSP